MNYLASVQYPKGTVQAFVSFDLGFVGQTQYMKQLYEIHYSIWVW